MFFSDKFGQFLIENRRLGGASPASPAPATGRSASFRFRFVRAVRAGEAKLCMRVRRASLTLGLGSAGKFRLRAVWGAIVDSRKRGFH